ncbi:CsbD family protein [Lusitaniella coriacea]|nr:CsbD family protein [Lusitaniella coriacea]
MSLKSSIEKVLRRTQKLLSICLSVAILTLTGMGVGFSWAAPANALTVDRVPLVMADSNPLNKIFGAGTTDKIEGKAEQDIGTVKRNAGKVQGEFDGVEGAARQVEGAAQQAKGKAQKDIGTVKNKADEVGSNIKESAKDLRDSAEDLFDR